MTESSATVAMVMPRFFEMPASSRIPQEILDHVHRSDDLLTQDIQLVETSFSGSFKPVRIMIWADFVEGMSRAAYELKQGPGDFGWLDTEEPNWKPPEVRLTKDETTTKYTGEESFVKSQSFEFRNYGSLDSQNLTLLGNADPDSTDIRDGGFGQGLKVALCELISTNEDRISALEAQLANNKSGLTDREKQKIGGVITKFKQVEEDNHHPFVTIQAKRKDGTYYRAYAFRESITFNNKPSWRLSYAITELDPTEIDKEDLNTVIVRVHNPDEDLSRVFDDAPENILDLNPRYKGPKSLVRLESDIRPAGNIREYASDPTDESRFYTNWGTWKMERLDGVTKDPKIFFRGTAMKPASVNDLRLSLYSWNISEVDEGTLKEFDRVSNSTAVTGRVNKLIESCVGKDADPGFWEKLFRNIPHELFTQTQTGASYPEFEPSINTSINPEVLAALRTAFESVYGENASCYFSEDQNTTYTQLTGNETNSIQIPRELRNILTKAGITNTETELDKYLSSRYGFSETTPVQTLLLPPDNQKALQTNIPNDQSPEDILFNIMFDECGLDFGEHGHTYMLTDKNQLVISVSGLDMTYAFSMSSNSGGINMKLDHYSRNLPQAMYSLHRLGLKAKFVSIKEGTPQGFTLEELPNGRLMLLQGKLNRNGNNTPGMSYFVIEGKPSQLMDILGKLDQKTIEIDPKWVNARAASDLETTLTSLQTYRQKLEAELAQQRDTFALERQELTDELAQLKEQTANLAKEHDAKVQLAQQALLEIQQQATQTEALTQALKGEAILLIQNTSGNSHMVEDAGMVFTGNGRDGVTLDALLPDSFIAGGSGYEMKLENRHFIAVETATDRDNQVRTERIRFDRIHYRMSVYGSSYETQTYFPLQAMDQTEMTAQGIRTICSTYDYVYAGKRNNESIWRGYDPNKNQSALVRTDHGQTLYHAILETSSELLPSNGQEAVLPIDGRKYEVTYIQLPMTEGAPPKVPALLYDQINQQYKLQFPQTEEALTSLPTGTRFYLRERPQETISEEARLVNTYPTYYAELTRHLLDINRLDPEARKIVDFIRSDEDLSRNQKVKAIYEFWTKRHVYDDETRTENIEELIASGRGVCRHSETALRDLLKAVGVPARARVVYPDNKKTGILTPPFHGMTEYLNDEGNWQTIDPPNNKLSGQLVRKIHDSLLRKDQPMIHEAASLSRKTSFPNVTLPDELNDLLNQSTINPGLLVDEAISSSAERILNGRDLSIVELEQMIIQLLGMPSEGSDEPLNLTTPPDADPDLAERMQRLRQRLGKKSSEPDLDMDSTVLRAIIIKETKLSLLERLLTEQTITQEKHDFEVAMIETEYQDVIKAYLQSLH